MFEKFRKNDEKEFKRDFEGFVKDLRVIEDKYNIFLKPIITQDGPKFVPSRLKNPNVKSYVETNQGNFTPKNNEVPEK